ncbi:glycine betaine ABC transporter substrate-binding protein, partial [Staphylococcus epidermidis]|uniref:glycine betaine ABC transporter substrate-binding protein n=1 Tax=Staphylococcus epidermidis TaxID=1282 RepID=UPI0037DA76B4
LHLPLPYSTHPPIPPYHLKILQHHRKFFPPYHPTPLANQQLINDNPQIHNPLKKLQAKISTQQIHNLNYQPHPKPNQPPLIPQQYLNKHHYFEE